MKWLLELSLEHERPLLLCLMFVVIGVLYLGAQAVPTFQSAQALDWDPVWRLPYVSAFILPYWSLFIMPLFFLVGARDNAFFRRWILTAVATAAVSVLVFIAWPLTMPYPPLADNDPFSSLVALTYYMDVRSNFCPSLHVVLAYLMALGVGYEKPGWRWPMLIWATIIAASTMFVRQHYAIDVASGLVLAAIAWVALTRFAK